MEAINPDDYPEIDVKIGSLIEEEGNVYIIRGVFKVTVQEIMHDGPYKNIDRSSFDYLYVLEYDASPESTLLVAAIDTYNPAQEKYNLLENKTF